MRRSFMIAAGLGSAAVLAIAGIASAHSETPLGPSIQQTTATTAVGQVEAERAALSVVPDGTVTETRLDSDNGRTVWNVHLSTPGGPIEVKVDGQTGEVRIDDDGDTAVPNTGQSNVDDHGDDANDDHGDDANDDHGHGRDDGSGHDANDDHGHGRDDGSGHH